MEDETQESFWHWLYNQLRTIQKTVRTKLMRPVVIIAGNALLLAVFLEIGKTSWIAYLPIPANLLGILYGVWLLDRI